MIKDLLSIPDLEVHLSPLWGSNLREHRADLRKAIAEQLRQAGALEDALGELDNLSVVPEFADGAISISHCRTLGGWAGSRSVQQLGFDIELEERVRPELVLRICTPQEFDEAPNPAALWTAKESVFKRLRGPDQPARFNDINVGSWAVEDDETYSFQAMYRTKRIRGCTWRVDDEAWASLC